MFIFFVLFSISLYAVEDHEFKGSGKRVALEDQLSKETPFRWINKILINNNHCTSSLYEDNSSHLIPTQYYLITAAHCFRSLHLKTTQSSYQFTLKLNAFEGKEYELNSQNSKLIFDEKFYNENCNFSD